jgi:Ca2+-binding EF-hand superfamily protein
MLDLTCMDGWTDGWMNSHTHTHTQEAAVLFEKLDINKDGLICREEFLKAKF